MGSPRWSRVLAGPVDPWRERSPGWSRFAGRACDPAGDPRWSSLLLKDCAPWKGPMLEQVMKNCSLWEGLTLEKFVENGIPWEGPYAGAGEEREEPSPEEERAAETTCDELTATPIPRPPALLGGKEVEKIGSKVKPGKKGGVGGRCFSDLVLFLIILL